MKGETHALGGVCTGLVYAAIMEAPISLALAVIGVSTAGSLFPDIDTRTSKVGSKVKHLSSFINRVFGHRTLFHAPLLYVTVSALLGEFLPDFQVYWTAFFLGVMSHLLLDMLNPKGIPLLYPYPKKYRLARMKCGGKGEKVICAMLMLAVLFWISVFAVQGDIALPMISTDL